MLWCITMVTIEWQKVATFFGLKHLLQPRQTIKMTRKIILDYRCYSVGPGRECFNYALSTRSLTTGKRRIEVLLLLRQFISNQIGADCLGHFVRQIFVHCVAALRKYLHLEFA